MRKIILMVLLAVAACGGKSDDDKEDAVRAEHRASHASLNSQFGQGPRAPEAKFSDMLRKAESGDARSQMGVARMYYNGDGVTKDDAKAAEWYLKAAEQGNELSQYKLGEMYEKGEGVPKDLSKAKEWWDKAAAQGSGAAQDALKQLAAKQ